MSTIIKFDLKELRKLVNDKNSCVIEKRVTQNLALMPWCLGNLKESIKNLLDYKIGKFDKEYNGILLSYKNLVVLQNIGTIRNDNAEIHFKVQADYYIFCPYVGATLTGVVNKKSNTHLGILVHKVFNVVIPRPTEEPGNKWIGVRVQEGQEVTFRIVVLDLYGALPYIRGELDERCIKSAAAGDDEELEVIQPLNVSYVVFDKTKPSIQKERGDGSPQLLTHKKIATENNLRSSPNVLTKCIDDKKTRTKQENTESSVTESRKTKRSSKLEIDGKEQNTKLSKKHKRES